MATRDYRTIQSNNPLAYAALPQGQRPAWLGSAEMDQYQNGGVTPSGGLGDMLLNGNQGLTSMDPQGYMVRNSAPTFEDRFGRGVAGLFKGADTGNKYANAGVDVVAGMTGPIGQGINSGVGAAQGFMSNKPVFNREMPDRPSYTPDVMPRGIMADGGLTPQATGGGGGDRNALNYGVGGTPPGGATGLAGFAQNPVSGRPAVPGQPATNPATGTGFTGGSGAMVDPYTLPAENDLLALLSNPERYGGFDAATGRTGLAGKATGAGGYTYGGFDFSQDAGNRDIGKSAKYAFSQFAEQAAKNGAPMPRTKAEAETWFTQHIAPGLQAAGYEIGWIKGDKARIKTREGWDEIDFLGNADGDNPTLTWQSEVLAPGPQMSGGGMGMGGGSLPTSGMDLTSSALFDALMAQAQAIASGQNAGANVLDTQALINLLQQRG